VWQVDLPVKHNPDCLTLLCDGSLIVLAIITHADARIVFFKNFVNLMYHSKILTFRGTAGYLPSSLESWLCLMKLILTCFPDFWLLLTAISSLFSQCLQCSWTDHRCLRLANTVTEILPDDTCCRGTARYCRIDFTCLGHTRLWCTSLHLASARARMNKLVPVQGQSDRQTCSSQYFALFKYCGICPMWINQSINQ